MSLIDDVLAELPQMRQYAESLMLDYGTASRPTGGFEYVDGADVEASDPLFDSPCKIQTRQGVVATQEVGGRTAASIRLELHLPVDTAPLQTGDLFTVTTPHALSTVPTGTVYRISGPVEGTAKTARRYEVERVTS